MVLQGNKTVRPLSPDEAGVRCSIRSELRGPLESPSRDRAVGRFRVEGEGNVVGAHGGLPFITRETDEQVRQEEGTGFDDAPLAAGCRQVYQKGGAGHYLRRASS
jgi:hypothetical protein